jgi:hypothetical protein
MTPEELTNVLAPLFTKMEEQAQFAREQAKRQEEQAKRQEEQVRELAKRQEEQFAYICAELAEIKSNTSIIRDRVLSKSDDISPAMEATSEEEMTAITEPEVAEAIVSYRAGLPVVGGVKLDYKCLRERLLVCQPPERKLARLY